MELRTRECLLTLDSRLECNHRALSASLPAGEFPVEIFRHRITLNAVGHGIASLLYEILREGREWRKN